MAVSHEDLSTLTKAVIDLLKELGDVKEKWGRTDGKIDAFIAQMEVQDERAIDYEARLRKVENRQHWYSGVAAAIGAILGIGIGRGVHP